MYFGSLTWLILEMKFSSHGTLCDRLRCPDLHRTTSEITVQLNQSRETMVHLQDGIRLASYLRYSLSSIPLLGQGECLLVCNNYILTKVTYSIFATPSTILGLSGSVGLSLYVYSHLGLCRGSC